MISISSIVTWLAPILSTIIITLVTAHINATLAEGAFVRRWHLAPVH